MKSETLSRYLGQPGLREQLAADEDSAVIGIAADPEDARRNCTVLYVPPEFSRSLLESFTLGGETVRVVRRERGGPLRAYATT